MRNFYFLNSLIFILFINNAYSSNEYTDCPEGKYGLNCEKDCNCSSWSSNKNCSRLVGKCLWCKFGHFGVNCNDICYPNCKTNLCCTVHSKSERKSQKMEINMAKTISIKVDNQVLKIVPDFNVGYTLTIFNNTLETPINLFNKTENPETFQYSNYNVSGYIYEDNSISIINSNENKALDLRISILVDTKISTDDINGVIGFDFLNSISEEFFIQNKISENLVSYSIIGNEATIIFGDLFEEEKDYVHKLSFCNYNIKDGNMKCKVNGIKVKGYSNSLTINNTEVKFGINEESSFILKNNNNIIFYIKKYFFNDKSLKEEHLYAVTSNDDYSEERVGSSTYFCYKNDNFKKLSYFGFIINNFYYSFKPDNFFKEDEKCGNGQYKFIIEFSDENEKFVIGKEFLKDTQLTIDREEKKIYFYTRNAEYFSGRNNSFFIYSLDIEPLNLSLIVTGGIFLLNILAFLVYFLIKRKKEKIN